MAYRVCNITFRSMRHSALLNIDVERIEAARDVEQKELLREYETLLNEAKRARTTDEAYTKLLQAAAMVNSLTTRYQYWKKLTLEGFCRTKGSDSTQTEDIKKV